jgi:NtrC-family two-component system response regulator AlgB
VLRIAKDKEEAARMLGIDPATLWRKRKKYGL